MGRRLELTILTSCLLAAGAADAVESAETVKVAPAASETPRTVTVVPGARYQAGWLYGFFLGEHWRDTWTTPVQVPLLDLDAFDGGLRPDRLAGGMETVNLHFKSGNGNTWAFRSVDKEPGRTLDPDTRDSWIGDLFQDETSTAQPYGALMVPPLLDAAGVLHTTPQLAVLPDDPRLGEFHQYAGMLGLLEERIERGLEEATMVSDTLTLFQRLEDRGDERVDARAYLRARLIDILVGDWDRHVFQWRWARFEKDGERLWEPIPRDRDQAFSRFDGVVPSVAEYYTKQLAGFAPGYAPIDKLTFSGSYTDRRFLVALDKKDWEAVTSEVVAKLTDTVISEAVHRLPPPLYEKDGADLEKSLRSRRDALAEASPIGWTCAAPETTRKSGSSGRRAAPWKSPSTSTTAGLARRWRRRTSTGRSGPRTPRRSACTRWAVRTTSRSRAWQTRPFRSGWSRQESPSRFPTGAPTRPRSSCTRRLWTLR